LVLLTIYGCDNYTLTKNKVIKDTIIFNSGESNKEFGDLLLLDFNSNYLSSLKENTSYFIRLLPNKHNFKYNLIPLTENLIIEPYKDNFNEFVIKTKELPKDKTSEWAIINFKFDTTYNQPIVFRRDFDDSTNLTTYEFLDWKGIGTFELKIKKIRMNTTVSML
jgi:hypothetical protein